VANPLHHEAISKKKEKISESLSLLRGVFRLVRYLRSALPALQVWSARERVATPGGAALGCPAVLSLRVCLGRECNQVADFGPKSDSLL
jgi:hypothetical protein